MAEYKKIFGAGNIAGVNTFKIRIDGDGVTAPPQLRAWDNYQLNSTDIESLTGTVANNNQSMIAAADTSLGAVASDWAPATSVPGGALVNRLRGNDSWLEVGNTPQADGTERTFKTAFGLTRDMTPGVSGHLPVLAFTVYYAGAAPTVTVYANIGDENTPVWVELDMGQAGQSVPQDVLNTIVVSGKDDAETVISTVPDPVTKPVNEEKWAESQWLQTGL